MSIKSKRNTSIEILRIICMFMIITGHFVEHGGLLYTTDASISNRILAIVLFNGKLAVSIYVIISAYFMINSKIKFQKILKLYLEVLFYSLSFLLITFITDRGALNKQNILNAIFPLFFKEYWFFTIYAVLYLISPILNIALKSISKKQHIMLIAIQVILFSIMHMLRIGGGSDIDIFILLYTIGAYIKIYPIKTLNTQSKKVTVLLFGLILYYMIMIALLLKDNKINLIMSSQYSILMIFIATMIFLIVKDINIKCYNIINKIANLSFATYLIHDNLFVRKILWTDIIKVQNYYNSPTIKLFVYAMGCATIIYAISIFIEQIRIILFKKIRKLLNKKIQKESNKIENINKILNIEEKP